MPLVLINPDVKPFGEMSTASEGCLEFPEMYAQIDRPAEATVRATNEKGQTIEFSCGGLITLAPSSTKMIISTVSCSSTA